MTEPAAGADNERRLARKCAELSSQAVEASAKAQTAQVLGAKDSKTIATLKEEVDRAWAALESSHQKARRLVPCPGVTRHAALHSWAQDATLAVDLRPMP